MLHPTDAGMPEMRVFQSVKAVGATARLGRRHVRALESNCERQSCEDGDVGYEWGSVVDGGCYVQERHFVSGRAQKRVTMQLLRSRSVCGGDEGVGVTVTAGCGCTERGSCGPVGEMPNVM